MKKNVAGMREQIDELDRELLKVVAERIALVRKIGDAKGSDGPVRDAEREQAVVDRWAGSGSEHGLAAALTTRLLREVITHSRCVQQIDRHAAPSYLQWARRIGYQGDSGAYSELAIRMRTGQTDVETFGYRSFAAVFEALASGAIDCAMVPIENTIVGSVEEVTTLLISTPVVILDEELVHIQHCLASTPGATLDGIRTVMSHPVALQQCLETFVAMGIEPEPYFDTAGAAAEVAVRGDRSIAALCSAEAAEYHGLEIVARNIEDDARNFTRFLLLGAADDARIRRDSAEPRPYVAKTSLVVTLANRSGALARCLQVLASKGLNLTRIDSRPRPPWEYLFVVDFDGHAQEVRVEAALNELRAEVEELRVIGSYPNRTSFAEPGEAVPDAVVTVSPSVESVTKNDSRLVLLGDRKRTIVHVGDVAIGGDRFVLIAGPCAVESRVQIRDAAQMAQRAGARMLRGGAFKPRTSPYSFQGLGLEGTDLLAEAGREAGLPVVTEVLDVRHLQLVAERADMIQVGARNMQNFELLKELGRIDMPVLLKRGMSATLEELLDAAEYILAGGNERVVLCERGIRTFERATRSTLDIAAIPFLKARTHLPVIADPSHAAGRRDLVIPLALAAVAAGADALIVEVHPRPDEALSDREQALGPGGLDSLAVQLRALLLAQGRPM